ncbi:MAG: beta-N-acetylhexosaminidase [Lachnospiraceae bacterium]|nr:beta-N-acetylhexosaminidase [Lachnospiraceae bacterium]
MERTQVLAERTANEEQARKDERARVRHKRRVRNQIAAYAVVAAFTVGMGAFLYIGSMKLLAVISVRRQTAKVAAEAEAYEDEAVKNAEAEMAEEAEAAEEPAEEVTVETPAQVEEEMSASEEVSDEELLNEMVSGLIEDMPLKDRVAGLFVVSPERLTNVDTAIKAGDGTRESLEATAVGGIIYSAKNIKNHDQICSMLEKTVEMSKYPLFLGLTDAGEGGDPVKSLSLEEVPSAAELAESGDAAKAYDAGETIAKKLVDAGFNMALSPRANLTADAMTDEERRASFGSDPASAQVIMAGEIQGLEENGIKTAVGFFPTTADDRSGNIPVTNATVSDLEEGEYAMFKTAVEAGTKVIMVGNLAAPQITGDNTSSSMSSVIINEQLRSNLGYDVVVMTDSLSESAITDYLTADQAAVNAIKAGADMIYEPEDLEAALDGVLDAVNSGVIPESRINESLTRIYKIKYADKAD